MISLFSFKTLMFIDGLLRLVKSGNKTACNGTDVVVS
jgi:hypothetical protein